MNHAFREESEGFDKPAWVVYTRTSFKGLGYIYKVYKPLAEISNVGSTVGVSIA